MKRLKIMLCMALLTSIVVIGGCSSDEAPDVKEIFANVEKNQKTIESMDADMNIAIEIEIADGKGNEIPMNMDSSGKVLVDENASMHMKMNMNASTFGADEKVETELYQLKNGDGVVQYASEDGKNWIKSEADTFENPLEMLSSEEDNIYKEITKNPDSVKYVGKSKVNKKSAYEFLMTLNAEDLKDLPTGVLEEAEGMEGLLDLVLGEDFEIEVSLFVYEEEERVAKIVIDYGDAFEEMFNAMLSMAGEEAEGMEVNLDEFTIEIAFAYNNVDEITVPAEVEEKAELFDGDMEIDSLQ